MKKQILLAIALLSATWANAQFFDTTGIDNWASKTNSYSTWMTGAFEAGRDTSDAFDFGWGYYDMTTHLITGDSIYIIKTANGNYKAISIDNIASGTYTVTFSNLDKSGKTTKTFNRSNYANRNFFYYSIDADQTKNLEPATQDWDVMFTRYLTIIPGFGGYPVAGILTNIGVEVSEVKFASGTTPAISDTTNFPMSSDISTIGYDWKSAGPNGTTIHDTVVYYVKDQNGTVNELKMTGYGGSGTGKFVFNINGSADSISLGAGNLNQVYYSLSAGDTVATTTDRDWDVAFYAQSSFSSIPVRINDVNGVELYVYPNADITYWNTVGEKEYNLNVLSVYPNPANDVLNIALTANDGASINTEIIDASGKVVKTNHFNTTTDINNMQINVSGLNSGMYIVRLSGEHTIATARILIQ